MCDQKMLDANPLTYLNNLLANLKKGTSDGVTAENSALIDWLSQTTRLRSILLNIVNTPSLLAEVACRSYRHVNHFDKMVLIGNDSQDGYRLTLHCWDPPYSKKELADELIHDHRFDFWSAIIVGTLVSDNFEEGDVGHAYRKYRYIPERRGVKFNDFYEYRGETCLRRMPQSRLESGSSYSIVGPKIHQVILPMTSMTCTLVLRGPRLRSYANIYNTTYPADNTEFDNSMFSTEKLAGTLNKLITKLR